MYLLIKSNRSVTLSIVTERLRVNRFYIYFLPMVVTGCRIHCNIGNKLTINFDIDLIYAIT